MTTAILGAGIAGLAAAHYLHENGERATVYEKSHVSGGLLAPLTFQGFTFDTAVHLSFATETEVRSVFDKTDYVSHNPESWCWDAGYWLKHPVQTNLYPLPLDDKVDMISGLVAATPGPIDNYRDWLVQQYGEPIAKRWPLIYTEKYWTIPAERLGTKWVGDRMRKADLKEVIAGALSKETPNHYYVKEMRYPRSGGYHSFIKPLVDQADISFDCCVDYVCPNEKRLRFSDGRVLGFDKIISTMPLPKLVEMMPDVPEEIRRDAASLFATSIDLISIGFNRPKVSPALWFYIYDSSILAARAYSPDWKSIENVPAGCSALQFEIYSSREKPQQNSPRELIANTIQGLRSMGLAEERDILFAEHTFVPYANVVFDLGMEARRDRVRDWVRSKGIELAGRFGEWEYLWSNQSFMSGYKAAERSMKSNIT